MKKIILLKLLIVFVSNIALSQTVYECAMTDEELNNEAEIKSGSSCELWASFVPDQTNNFQNTPLLVVNINYHLFRASDGSGFFSGKTQSDVQNQVNDLNYYYENIGYPNLPTNPPAEFIPDARIRFVLKEVYFHDVDSLEDINTNVISIASFFNNNFGVNKDNEINIFNYHNSTDPIGRGYGPQSFVVMQNNNLIGAGLLAHELGHVLNLPHTFSGCSQTIIDDIYFPDYNRAWLCGASTTYSSSQSSCPSTGGVGVSNNIMGYNSCQRYFSPKQIARMHHHKISKDQKRKYVTCDSHSFDTDVEIVANAIWESRKVIDGNLTVKAGKTLTIKCKLYLKPSSKIVVEPNARLIIDGGILTNYCDNLWQGIEVWGNSNEHQFPGTQPTHQGKLEVINGGVIENANTAVILWKPGDWTSMGGVVYTDNAVFRNNKDLCSF